MFGNQSKVAGLFVAFFLVLFTGCTEGAPTAPEQVEVPVGQVATPAEIEAQVAHLIDVSERLIPALEDQALAKALAPKVSEAAKALEARDSARVTTAVAAALEVLTAYEAQNGTETADAPDLGGIYLNLWYTAASV